MPQRFLRPGITNSDRFNSVPFDSQSLFVRLLTIVDDFGRCDGRTAVVSAMCFAVWNEINPEDRRNLQQVERILQQLEKVQLIERYESLGKRVLQITQWQERIRTGVKERWPCRNLQQDYGELLPTITIAQNPEASPLAPINWSKTNGFQNITLKDRADWSVAYPACNLDRQFAAMNEWLISNPKKAVKSNWRQFVTNWLSRSQDRGGDMQSNGNHKTNTAQSDRNAGTCNEGKSSQYRGVGKVR